jgi:hypothetical protein
VPDPGGAIRYDRHWDTLIEADDDGALLQVLNQVGLAERLRG